MINIYRENVGYASTCNSVGQTIGAFLGYVVFITLESPTFCNKWLRYTESTEGLITLQGNLKIYYIGSLVHIINVYLLTDEIQESSFFFN